MIRETWYSKYPRRSRYIAVKTVNKIEKIDKSGETLFTIEQTYGSSSYWKNPFRLRSLLSESANANFETWEDYLNSYADVENPLIDNVSKGYVGEIEEDNFDITNHQVGTTYHLEKIKDYDGNLHANSGNVSDDLKSAYKYQGKLDVNNDGVIDGIYTNKVSGRWVTAKIDSYTEKVYYSNHGDGGGTRVVGI